ncbi:MAG: SRPBCC family protein [Egibacteraceae bacterium]
MRGSASIAINASPDDVYAVLSDVTRMGDLSPECYKCEWNGGSAEAVTGATFIGHNRLGEREWSTFCEITAAESGRLFTFEVGSPEVKYVRWTYALEPDGADTTVTESFEPLAIPPVLEDVTEEHRAQRTAALIEGMNKTLARLKEVVEGG